MSFFVCRRVSLNWWVIDSAVPRFYPANRSTRKSGFSNVRILGHITFIRWNPFFAVFTAFTNDLLKTWGLWIFIDVKIMLKSYKYVCNICICICKYVYRWSICIKLVIYRFSGFWRFLGDLLKTGGWWRFSEFRFVFREHKIRRGMEVWSQIQKFFFNFVYLCNFSNIILSLYFLMIFVN